MGAEGSCRETKGISVGRVEENWRWEYNLLERVEKGGEENKKTVEMTVPLMCPFSAYGIPLAE